MDKILLCAVNSKYIHTSLSVRALYHYANDDRVLFCEYTINDKPYTAMNSIYAYQCDVVLFSCYIWNINFILETASMLKAVSPKTQIILGGPEVSYNYETVLKEHPYIDAIIYGEGEETFKQFLTYGLDIDGTAFRSGDKIIANPPRKCISDLSLLPFPYSEEDLITNANKLLYYEGSRGCPFSCSYCMSSTLTSVRYKPIEIVKKELMIFINHNVKIVKFVDRTFNADKKRTYEILKFLINNAKNTTFHFEVAADILNDDIINLLSKAPKGLFQLEIGVQTTNPSTLSEIDRKANFEKISQNVKKILLAGNIHVHLDLIAGLPYEDIVSFKKSFNDVFMLGADVIQLGFLKLLHGTKIREQSEKHNYIFTTNPPYEVLSNKYMSFDDITLLKGIDTVVDRFYNSNGFENAIKYLIKKYPSPFDMFVALSTHIKKYNIEFIGISKQSLYTILSEFCKDKLFADILKFDFLSNNKPQQLPWFLDKYDETLQKSRFDILSEKFIQDNLPEYENVQKREIIKTVHFEKFSYDIMGDYTKKDNIIVFDKKYGHILKIRRA